MSENLVPSKMHFQLVHHTVAPLPAPDQAQCRVLELAAHNSVVVRGAPGSGRTATALLLFQQAVAAGQSAQLWVPDQVRVDVLSQQVAALKPQAVRPVRTPLAWAFAIVNTWRTNRPDPLGPLELITGAAEDAELADLLATVDAPWPSSLDQHMRGMPAFRLEVRNLFARCGEAGLDAVGLRKLGEKYGHPAWVAAAQILLQWQNTPSHSPQFRGTMVGGIATLQSTAAELLGRWSHDLNSGLISADPPVPDLVIVDDTQDMNAATLTLVKAVSGVGARVVSLADPDVATSGYRGGEPHLDGLLEESLGAAHVELGDVYRGGPRLRALTQALVQTVPSHGPIARRSAGARNGEASESIGIHVAASVHQLGALIARDIRGQHVHQGTPYDQQAIVVRSQSDLAFFSRSLERSGVPLHSSSSVHTFSAEPVSRILLQLLAPLGQVEGTVQAEPLQEPKELEESKNSRHSEDPEAPQAPHSLGENTAEEELAQKLMESVLVGVDALDIQRVQLHFQEHADQLAENLVGSTTRTMLALLNNAQSVEQALNQEDSPQVAPDFAQKFQRAARIWEAWRSIRHAVHMGPQVALWKLWDSAQVAEQWRASAVAPTPLRGLGCPGDHAWFDQQLDSVMALFRVADVWEQRNPEGAASQFAAQLLEENVASDTLATPGLRPPGVWVVTPAQALGRTWESVWVAGLQDGHWPNVRLRDRMLRSDLIIPAARGQAWEPAMGDTRVARRATENDDMRLLIAAVTRSRGRLNIGAVSNEDQAPSPFVLRIRRFADEAPNPKPALAPQSQQADDASAYVLEEVRPPLNLDGQAGSLRHIAAAGLLLTATDQEKQLQPVASAVIAVLALEGVRSAQPASWCGAGGLSSTAAVTTEGPVTITSSSIETAIACPLRWFLEQRAGARPLSTGPATLGSLIHSIAQDFPSGTLAQLQQAFQQRFEELELEPGSLAAKQTRQVGQTLVEGLADYIVSVKNTSADVEVPFSVELGDVRLSGRIDRLEHVDGGVRITDFKTGATKVSEEEALNNPQLAAYQIAQSYQGHDVVGARLVYPRFVMKKKQQLFDVRVQPGFDVDQREQWIGRLNQVATRLRGPSFQAFPSGPWKQPCRTCSFQRVCPAYESAQRTIE